MAIAQLNPVFDGFSGKSGGMVFRRVHGTLVVGQAPGRSKRGPTTAQADQRARFLAGTAYVRRVLGDPWQRRHYETLAAAQNRRVDKLVLSDFLTPPVVEAIDATDYRGAPGGLVRVLATDDVEVVAVEVAIRTEDETEVERGPAEKIHGVWCYRATTHAPAGPLVIHATARDRPGNRGKRVLLAAFDL